LPLRTPNPIYPFLYLGQAGAALTEWLVDELSKGKCVVFNINELDLPHLVSDSSSDSDSQNLLEMLLRLTQRTRATASEVWMCGPLEHSHHLVIGEACSKFDIYMHAWMYLCVYVH
jgi:hypothetical protein